MPLTLRFSTTTTWFSLTSFLDNLCRKSWRDLVTRSYTLATVDLALFLDLLPFCFLASFCCLRLRFFSRLARCLGFSYLDTFSASLVIAKCFNPKSTPMTLPTLEGVGFSPSISVKIDARSEEGR